MKQLGLFQTRSTVPMEMSRIYSEEKAVLLRSKKVETVGSILKNNGLEKGDLRPGLCLTFVLVHSKKFHIMVNLVLWLDIAIDPKILGEQGLLI